MKNCGSLHASSRHRSGQGDVEDHRRQHVQLLSAILDSTPEVERRGRQHRQAVGPEPVDGNREVTHHADRDGGQRHDERRVAERPGQHRERRHAGSAFLQHLEPDADAEQREHQVFVMDGQHAEVEQIRARASRTIASPIQTRASLRVRQPATNSESAADPNAAVAASSEVESVEPRQSQRHQHAGQTQAPQDAAESDRRSRLGVIRQDRRERPGDQAQPRRDSDRQGELFAMIGERRHVDARADERRHEAEKLDVEKHRQRQPRPGRRLRLRHPDQPREREQSREPARPVEHGQRSERDGREQRDRNRLAGADPNVVAEAKRDLLEGDQHRQAGRRPDDRQPRRHARMRERDPGARDDSEHARRNQHRRHDRAPAANEVECPQHHRHAARPVDFYGIEVREPRRM